MKWTSWKKLAQIPWSRLLKPLPLLTLILGMYLSIWVASVVHEQEKKNLDRQNSQRSSDIIDRAFLLINNSILRIQSYDELFELNSHRAQQQLPTIQRALRHTIFKRLTVFKLEKMKSPTDGLPVLKRKHLIDAIANALPINPSDYMKSEAARESVLQVIQNSQRHQIFIHQYDDMPILSVVWKATAAPRSFYIFSTPLADFFAGVELYKGEALVVTDPLSLNQWRVSMEGNRIHVRWNDTFIPLKSTQMKKTTSTQASMEEANRLDLQLVTPAHQDSIPLYKLVLILGLLTTVFTTYLFWILISQNRRISKMIVEKTYALENANHDLQEAMAARSRFLANVSHEIRTPLNLIMGMIELSRETAVDEKLKTYLKSMATASTHLLGMVEDILDLSKAEFHSVDIKHRNINLLQFLEEIGRIIAPICAEKKLKFYLCLSADLPARLRSDPSRLRQILLNLLRNSTKYTQSGYILLRVSRLPFAPDAQDALRFEVEDSGIGIPKDRLGQVFDAFFQIQSAKILSGGGVGLGLSIVKDLVKKLNGRIEVQSMEGLGTTFKVDMFFETQTQKKWTENYSNEDSGKKMIFAVSADTRFADSLDFLSSYDGIEVVAVNTTDFEKLIAPSSSSSSPTSHTVILDASTPPTKSLEIALEKFAPQRIIYCGDRRNSIRSKGSAQMTKIEANPVFPAQILASLGFSSQQPPQQQKTDFTLISVPRSDQPQEHLSIVVADDDVGNRELFAAYLEPVSKDVRFAEDGAMALDLCQEKRPDVLVADLRMPNMDGFTLIERIRDEEKEKQLKPMRILLITADALEETAERAKASAADVYLTKPIRKTQLLSALRAKS